MRNESEIPVLYNRIRDVYQLKRKIGKGGFGVIYSAENITSKEQLAVKFEKIRPNNQASSNLFKETKILHQIHKKNLTGRSKVNVRVPTDSLLQQGHEIPTPDHVVVGSQPTKGARQDSGSFTS